MPSAPHVALAASLESGLARLGLEAFRPGQREAIETLLEAGLRAAGVAVPVRHVLDLLAEAYERR